MPKSNYSSGSSKGTKRGAKFPPQPPKRPTTEWEGYMDGRPSKGDLNQTFKG